MQPNSIKNDVSLKCLLSVARAQWREHKFKYTPTNTPKVSSMSVLRFFFLFTLVVMVERVRGGGSGERGDDMKQEVGFKPSPCGKDPLYQVSSQGAPSMLLLYKNVNTY